MKKLIIYFLHSLISVMQPIEIDAVLRSATILRRHVTEADGSKTNCYIWCFGDHHVAHESDLIQRQELLSSAQKMGAQIICEDKSDSSGITNLGLELPVFLVEEASKHYGSQADYSPMMLTRDARIRKISVRNVEFRQCQDFRDKLAICHEAHIITQLYTMLRDKATNLNTRFPDLLDKVCFGHPMLKYGYEYMMTLKHTPTIYSSEELAKKFIPSCCGKPGFSLGDFLGKKKNRPRVKTIFDKYISTLIEARILHTVREDGYRHKHLFVVCGDNHLRYSTRVENGQEIVHYGTVRALQDMGWEKIHEERSYEGVITVRECCKNFIPN